MSRAAPPRLVCVGVMGGQRCLWAPQASSVQLCDNGEMAIFDKRMKGAMGFRKGAWKLRRRLFGFDIYDVDFSRRFQPRASAPHDTRLGTESDMDPLRR